MLNQPTSSPMITRMFGLPEGADCWACATAGFTVAAIPSAVPATSALLASRTLRRFSFGGSGSSLDCLSVRWVLASVVIGFSRGIVSGRDAFGWHHPLDA